MFLQQAQMMVHFERRQHEQEQQHAQLAQKTAAVEQKTEILENRLQNVELQHRNGVPNGYLSRKQAHHLYGVRLGEEVFHLALEAVGVPSKPYIHRSESGYDVATSAYLEKDIKPAIDQFLNDAQQVGAKTCESPMLKGRRFRYVKQQ